MKLILDHCGGYCGKLFKVNMKNKLKTIKNIIQTTVFLQRPNFRFAGSLRRQLDGQKGENAGFLIVGSIA